MAELFHDRPLPGGEHDRQDGAGGTHRCHQVQGERCLPVLVGDLTESARPGRSGADVVNQDADLIASRLRQPGGSAGFGQVYLHNLDHPGSGQIVKLGGGLEGSGGDAHSFGDQAAGNCQPNATAGASDDSGLSR